MTDGSGKDEDNSAAMVTRLVNKADAGDVGAAKDLLPLVYEQLRALASRKMSHERSDHTLQTTALVHEAYLRLVDATKIQRWESRWHFFAAAAEAMRRILVENARHRNRQKRGGGQKRLNIDCANLTADETPDELLTLDEALTSLAETHPEKAKLVTLRHFAGLTHEEAAEAMGISKATAERHWSYARAWLYRWISSDGQFKEPE